MELRRLQRELKKRIETNNAFKRKLYDLVESAVPIDEQKRREFSAAMVFQKNFVKSMVWSLDCNIQKKKKQRKASGITIPTTPTTKSEPNAT